MMLKDIFTPHVIFIDKNSSLEAAAQLMKTNNVGSLIVTGEAEQAPIGIITDRDIVIKAIAQGKVPAQEIVVNFISDKLVKLPEHSSLTEAIQLMEKEGIRRIPIVNKQNLLCGIITLDDITFAMAKIMEGIVLVLQKQKIGTSH